MNVWKFLDRAEEMVQSCASCVPAEDNPGVAERGRRALRVHLGADVRAGLATLRQVIEQALR